MYTTHKQRDTAGGLSEPLPSSQGPPPQSLSGELGQLRRPPRAPSASNKAHAQERERTVACAVSKRVPEARQRGPMTAPLSRRDGRRAANEFQGEHRGGLTLPETPLPTSSSSSTEGPSPASLLKLCERFSELVASSRVRDDVPVCLAAGNLSALNSW
ncbi:hypothetical protein cyc_08503 [Cyclospora cayetanensis]|uniref:Uncharacterized protein n=1 Tax=Cyclospora cayetanensis TaxID=88456 RepID=A0A1D3D7K1_9EIME|nr:hypothetical protein cyc_08503 [Cyclospora cayetanensis]